MEINGKDDYEAGMEGWRKVGYDKVGYGKGSSFESFETCFSYRQLNQQTQRATANWILFNIY